MDFMTFPVEILGIATFILVLLFDSNDGLSLQPTNVIEDDEEVHFNISEDWSNIATKTVNAVMRQSLQNSRLWNNLSFLDNDLGYWVKPRSIVWFSRFAIKEFNDARWVEMFRMTKRAFFSLANVLSLTIQKKNIKYRCSVLVSLRLRCTLFKLCHGASLLICSEMFAVGRSIVLMMLCQVIQAINVELHAKILWPSLHEATAIANRFEEMCGLPGVMGAINCTHIDISKLVEGAADYYYFKSGGYTVNCQAVVDSSKRFLDAYVGMPGSTNDARILRRSAFFTRRQQNSL